MTSPPAIQLSSIPRCLSLATWLCLSGCAVIGGRHEDSIRTPADVPFYTASGEAVDISAMSQAAGAPPSSTIVKGSGIVVKATPTDTALGGPGDTTLNFEAADVRDIAKTVLAEILKENYVVDPKVTGTVSFRTVRPLSRDALLPVLETVLRLNGIVMVKENGVFKILPAAAAKGSLSPRLGRPGPGYALQVVPLKYAGAKELARILEAVAPDPSAIRVDESRNLLILAGTQNELQHMLDTIEMFDVDWLSGMSVGLFVLQNADVKAVDAELNKILGDKTLPPFSGAVRIIPLERLNGFVVITPQPEYLEQMKVWLERLDRAGGRGGARLFIYQVQNGKAEHLAELLNQTFGSGRAGPASASAPALAPGLSPAEISSSGSSAASVTAHPRNLPPTRGSTLAITDETGMTGGDIRVVADRENNALVILATPSGYEKIESALKKLDVAPRQVLIEVTIAEVTLKDELKYGVEWLFTNGARRSGFLDTDGKSGVGQLIPGFSYALALADGTGLQAALNALASDNRINILSSPHIMVADNQTAKIQVGDSVPIQTSTTTALATTAVTGTVTSTIQYLDTGVLLTVTPRINAGGLVSLDISQEVSAATMTTTSSLNSPTISKRSTKTQVTVQSGQTMVLGGLISENNANGSSGLPLLSSIPILGGLFGVQSRSNSKTELLLLITPRVANNLAQARQITYEIQRRMGEARDLLDCGIDAMPGAALLPGTTCPPDRRSRRVPVVP